MRISIHLMIFPKSGQKTTEYKLKILTLMEIINFLIHSFTNASRISYFKSPIKIHLLRKSLNY